MFLLDTNTLIYFFKGQGRVGEHLRQIPPALINVPTVVIYELEYGIARSTDSSKRRLQLDELLATIQVVPLNRRAAAESARLRAGLEAIGTPIGPIDTLIAGTALAIGATLASRNLREFSRVPGIQLVDWFD